MNLSYRGCDLDVGVAKGARPYLAQSARTDVETARSATTVAQRSLFQKALSLVEERERAPEVCHVTFEIPYSTCFGQSVLVSGSAPALGAWRPENALRLSWREGHTWCGSAQLPAGTRVAYKYIVRHADETHWEPGPDHVCHTPQDGTKGLTINDYWGASNQPKQ